MDVLQTSILATTDKDAFLGSFNISKNPVPNIYDEWQFMDNRNFEMNNMKYTHLRHGNGNVDTYMQPNPQVFSFSGLHLFEVPLLLAHSPGLG